MARLKPPNVKVPRTGSDDPRVGHLLGRSSSSETADVVIVGFPSDEGVRINGGRPGAAEGPARIRERLYRMTPDARVKDNFRHTLERTADLGDIEITGKVADDQQALGDVIATCIARGAVPIIIGGGHETAFGHFLGYVGAARKVSILNWDAHPDVRPLNHGLAHSGSPFRQALLHDSGLCRGYTVVGLSPHQTAGAHLEFIEEHDGKMTWCHDVTEERIREVFEMARDPMMVTFDLDAVDHAEAPGVSAPCVGGLSAKLWLRAAYEAGRCAAARSFDVVELNPQYDLDGRTARLAAMTVWSILRGLSKRKD